MNIMFSRALITIAVVLGFVALIALGSWRTVAKIEAIISERVSVAETARDAHWKAEIEKSNAIAAKNIIEQLRASTAAQLLAQATIDRLNVKLADLENQNAKLPDIACSGIDVGRTRLLNNQLIADDPH